MPKIKAQIETKSTSAVIKYPIIHEAAMEQQNVFWAAEKMGVDQDEQDFRTKLSEGEHHAVLLLQSILTQYELMIGGTEMWGGKIAKMFPRYEIQRMCATFAYAELASHAPFYKEGNKVLGRDTDEFYESCVEIPELRDHLKYIEDVIKSNNPLKVTAALCFLEGVVLFSAFAFFKSFNTNGFNLIPHFVAGIDASAKDENFHSQASAYLHNTCKQERELLGIETYEDGMIEELAIECYQHEAKIVELLYSVKPETMRTINKEDLLHFIRDRTNLVCGYLNHEPIFKQEKGIVSEWFYNNLSSFKSSDFFASTQVQYTKNHNKASLGFNTNKVRNNG